MVIQIDSREKAHAIIKILAEFERSGVKWFVSKLPVGDYISLDNPRFAIDRKQSLSEVYGNLCQQHERFKAELLRANDLGIKLIVLVEHGGAIRSLESVREWNNPRLKYSPYAWNGERLYGVMRTVADRYGVAWEFCDKRQTGRRIIELLKGGEG